MPRTIHSGAGIAIAALLLWSCGSSPTGATPPVPAPSGMTVTVNIVSSAGNNSYKPNPVSANAGDTVTFHNGDALLHHIVMDDGSADLGDVAPGATSRGITVRSMNAANFHCTIHPSMVGSINAAQPPETPPCSDPSGYGC